MIAGLRLLSVLKKDYGPEKVSYTLKPKYNVKGPSRSIQKFVVILMTTLGTDPIRPWFGTLLNKLYLMNVAKGDTTSAFVKEQVLSAISQYFRLQSEEAVQNGAECTDDDKIQSIDVVSITVDAEHHVIATLRFVPVNANAIIYSVTY